MRKSLSLAVIAILTIVLQPAPASATAYVNLVSGVQELYDAFPPVTVDCANLDLAPGTATRPTVTKGPGTPPFGDHSYRFSGDPTHAVGFRVPVSGGPLPELGISIANATPETGVASVSFEQEGAANQGLEHWIGQVTWQEPAGGWRRVDVHQRTYTWTRVMNDSGAVITDPDNGSTATITDFLAAHPLRSNDLVTYFFGFGCTADAFHLDGLRFVRDYPGSGLETQTWDFEGIELRCQLTRTATSTVAGSLRTIKAHYYDMWGTDVAAAPVSLRAKPYGATSFTTVASGNTSSTGRFSATVNPLHTTTYRSVMAQRGDFEACTTDTWVEIVRTRITANPVDSTITLGSPLVVTGRTTPAKPGSALTLWNSNERRLAGGTVRSDGTYRLTFKPPSRGKLTFYVTVAAGSGNALGISAMRAVSVS